MSELLRRLRWLLHRRRFERELDEEMEHHLAMKAEADGGAPFGNIALLKEDSRAMWSFTLLEQLFQDLRYGLRSMWANKVFTSMAVLSLALGIGANTAIYSFMDAILLRSLPVQHPEKLVILNWHSRDFPPVIHSFSGDDYKDPHTGDVSPHQAYPAFELLRANQQVLSNLFAFTDAGRLTVTVGGNADLAPAHYVSGGYFRGLGVQPAAGRLIADSDDRFGAPRVAVISYEYWQRRFALSGAAVGRTILLNNSPCTIAGVAARDFFGVAPGDAPELFLPLHSMPNPARFADTHYYWVQPMGRLAPGVSMAQAQLQLAPLYRRVVEGSATPKERADLPELLLQEGRSGIDALRRRYSKPLYVLMALVGLLLAIACANIANLLLSKAQARRREIAVRLSIGAGRARVIRQLMTESLLLGFAGGLLGAATAVPAIRFLDWLMINGRDGFRTGASLDWHVLAFTLSVGIVTSLAFGLAPAIQATRVDVITSLKETRASAVRGGLRGGGVNRFLVISQIALSLVLVLAAGLFVRGLSNLRSTNLGFQRENVLLFSMQAKQAGYTSAELVRLYEDLRRRLSVLPGVEGASLSDSALISGSLSGTNLRIPGRVNLPAKEVSVLQTGAGFFSTMKMPILLGREIEERDGTDAPRVAVVNELFARTCFPGADPIGRTFGLGWDGSRDPDIQIVGVSKDARYNSLKDNIAPTVYIPYTQNVQSLNYVVFELRTHGDPLAYAGSVRSMVHELAPRVPVFNFRTQVAQIDRASSQERIFADLCSCFAALALAIAGVGLYGTMAYAVTRRTNEIGIRKALGAERARIIFMVLREVIALLTVGLAVGLAVALAAGRYVESFLFGIKARDPAAISLSITILVAASLVAAYIPAWRASRIEPMEALRHE